MGKAFFRGRASTGSTYERELKSILEGDAAAVNEFGKSLSVEDGMAYRMAQDRPFLVIRAAGSFGSDLVALRDDFSFPIEVKSSKERVIRFGGTRLAEQAESFLRDCERAGIVPVYAYRLKDHRGDSWRLFRLPTKAPQSGFGVQLQRLVPEVRTTSAGNFAMDWDGGLPLAGFLRRVCEEWSIRKGRMENEEAATK